jgi:hypothetical protein
MIENKIVLEIFDDFYRSFSKTYQVTLFKTLIDYAFSFQSKKYLLNLGRYHRHTGVPSDYFGVMGTIFLHAVRSEILHTYVRWLVVTLFCDFRQFSAKKIGVFLKNSML